jgi:hypothetical protein
MSCLFESLSKFVSNMDADKLRALICHYLTNNPVIFDNIKVDEITNWESDMTLSKYVNRMKRSSTWGGGLEIRCFCNIYNVDVVVHYRGKKIEFIPEKQTKYVIHLDYTGNHYEPKYLEQK